MSQGFESSRPFIHYIIPIEGDTATLCNGLFSCPSSEITAANSESEWSFKGVGEASEEFRKPSGVEALSAQKAH